MTELLRTIGFMFVGSGIAAWVFTIWALKLVFQKRLVIKILPKKK